MKFVVQFIHLCSLGICGSNPVEKKFAVHQLGVDLFPGVVSVSREPFLFTYAAGLLALIVGFGGRFRFTHVFIISRYRNNYKCQYTISTYVMDL